MQSSTPSTYSNLSSTAPNLIPCPAPVAKVWTPSKRPRPLCHGDMTALDIQEGVIPVYDVQYMPFSDGRYKKFVESQQDYARGGYAKITLGQRINHERYEITAKLGVGHFGVVYLAWDRIDGRYVAIKIVRSSVKYARAAMAEDKLLTVIQGPMDDRKEYLVEYLDCFELEAVDGADDLFHVCLVFEVLGMSLLEVLRKNEFNGFPLRTAKHFIRQILQSISYLHSMDIIHTDIKPDNILLSHGSDIESMLTAQLRAQARTAEMDLQAEIDAGYDPLNTSGRVKTWLDYYKKMPGATTEQEEMIAKKRFEVESRKWQIIKSTPVESGIEFMKGTMIPYRPSAKKTTSGKAKDGSEKDKDKDSPPAQTQGLGDTIKRSKASTSTTQQRSSPSHPSSSKPKITTSNLTATAPQNTTASSSITQPPSAPLPFNCYSENADTPDKPSQPTVWDQAIADSGYNGNRIFPLTPEEMAFSAGLRNGGYNTGFKPPLLYSGLSTRNSSASPTTRLHKDFEDISLGLASYQRDDDAENDDPDDDFGVDMLEMRPRRPLTRNGSQRSIAGSISSNGSSSSNLASGGSSLFTNRTGGTIGTATTAGAAPYNYGYSYGTPTVTSSPEIGFTKSPTMALGISGLHRAGSRQIPFASPSSTSSQQATLYNNHTGFSCPSPEIALSGLPMHSQQQHVHAASPRQHSGSSTASPLSHLSNYFISPTSLALNGQRAFPYTSLSGSPAQSFVPTMNSMGMSAELASTSFGERHGQPMMGLGMSFAQQQQYLHGTGPAASTAVKPFSAARPKRADTSTTSLRSESSTSASTPTCGTPDAHTHGIDAASAQKVLPDLSNTKIKLADLGNAIFFGEMKGRNNLPEFVCTRQYRPPENLIGAPYDQGIDIWATACVVFEMLTGDLLFNPGSKRFKWSKEDDLLAQQIELLGPLPQHLLNAGKKTSHYFNSNGKLLKLKLKPWSLKDVLVEKYKMSAKQAEELTDFLLPMLAMDPAARCSADEALAHPWLSSDPEDDTILYRTPPPVLKLADPEVERKKREERAAAREKEDALLIQWQEEARRREEEYDRLQDEKRRLQEEEEDKRHWAQMREIERRRDGIYDPPKEEDDNSYPWGYPLRRYP